MDRWRSALTATGAAMGTVVLLSAAAVHWMAPTELIVDPGGGAAGRIDAIDHRYTSDLLNETTRRPWVVLGLLLLTLPPLVFAAQSARLGAPARDRRLAAIRLAGGTPGQIRLIAVVESGVACLAGALLGIGGYFALRAALNRPVMADPAAVEFGEIPQNPSPHLTFPTDALPPPWVFLAVALAVPAVAAALTSLALRRVTVTPLAVNRRTRMRGLRTWPLFLIGLGFLTLIGHLLIERNGIGDSDVVNPLTAWAAAVLLAAGTALSAAPLGQLAARVVSRRARKPASLLAARWILADPWSGSRSLAVLLVSVLTAAAATRGIGYLGVIGASGWSTEAGVHRFGLFVLVLTLVIAAAGLLFAIAEGLLTRRRALASLVAGGVPRGTLAKAVLWQALLPGVPAIVLAAGLGTTAMMLAETIPFPVSHSLGALALLAGGAIAGLLAAAGLSLPVLRSSATVSELRTE
jgi:hypothetical protein